MVRLEKRDYSDQCNPLAECVAGVQFLAGVYGGQHVWTGVVNKRWARGTARDAKAGNGVSGDPRNRFGAEG